MPQARVCNRYGDATKPPVNLHRRSIISKWGHLMRHVLTYAMSLLCLASPAWPETAPCPNSRYTVTAQHPTHIDMTCQATDHAEETFRACGLKQTSDPIRIDLVQDLQEGCVGLYHCGENWIEILEPPVLSDNVSSNNVFAFLPVDDYFKSIVVHELSHQLLDNMPCPFEACAASQEYVAFAMQIMSLTPDQRSLFEATHGLEAEISRTELNAMILFMAPNIFARKTWAHFNQRADSCGFIRDIMDGTVLLDFDQL